MKVWDCGALFAAAVAGVVTARKGLAMVKAVKQVFAGVLLAIMATEMGSQGDPIKGEEKKAKAVEQFAKALDPVLPDWLNPVVHGFLDLMIDNAVAWANRSGFFAQLSAASSG